MALRRFIVALCLALLFPASAALAKSVALVIGNDGYVNVAGLLKAKNDARAMAAKLEGLGFAVTVALDQDRDGFSRSLAGFAQVIEPGDTAFFFYAGHGFALEGENFLLPTDIPAAGPEDADIVRDASFAVTSIVERMRKRGAATAVLVLDACRDNPFAGAAKRALDGGRGLVRVDPPQGVFVLFSAGSGQSALDRLSNDDPNANSVFTRVLLQRLDAKGETLVRIAKETQIAVRSLAAKVGHEQTPAYYDQVIGDVVLNPGEPSAEAPEPLPQTTDVAIVLKPGDPLKAAGDLNRATQLYEEARAAEGRGDALGARRSYLAFSQADLDVIDPYLRFATLLRVQEGRAGAREVLGDLAGSLKSPALHLVYALQFEGEERRTRLEAILKDENAYPPALYQAALEVSDDRLGRAPTLAEKKRQRELLTAFLAEEQSGTLTRLFLDQSLLGDWIEDARTRLSAVSTAIDNVGSITAQYMRYNGGWSMTLVPPEPALEILVRDPAKGDFVSTGFLPSNDPRTGKPMPNPSISLPSDQPVTAFDIIYRDVNGADVGPITLKFDPDGELYDSQKRILESMPNNWVAARDWDGKLLLYTTMLASYACAIDEAYLGLDDAAPSQKLEIPPCDKLNPGAIPSDFQPYLTIPKKTQKVSIELLWHDGTRSKVSSNSLAAIMMP